MSETNFEVVCFGEILWDILPEKELPGGAPMNVAYHLNRLGHKSTILSRIGKDKRGEKLRAYFDEKKIDTSYLQVDTQYATGTVLATRLKTGDMQYEIVQQVAWDYIEMRPEFEGLVTDADYFVFGCLAARNEVSRNTLFQLLEIPGKKVMDINLRPPFFSKELVEHELVRTDILKMNEDELKLVSGWYVRYSQPKDNIRFLQDKFKIPTLIVTRGSRGAILNHEGAYFSHPGYNIKVADTIGSGDSFLAGFISKYIETGDIQISLSFASSVGSFMATQNGGAPSYLLGDIVAFMYTARLNEHAD